jgi:hypothetical protein
MSNKSNEKFGNLNIQAATDSILANGGGTSKKENWDGYKYVEGTDHITVYSRNENRHLSYNIDKDGNISNVHTDKDNRAFYNYKSGF